MLLSTVEYGSLSHHHIFAMPLGAMPNCQDFGEDNEGVQETWGKKKESCWFHIKWARDIGVEKHPDWYPVGTTKSEPDVQCALYLKNIGANEGPSHSCNLPPCAKISDSMMTGGHDVEKCLVAWTTTPPPARSGEIEVAEITTTTEAPGPSIEWWGWVLIALAVLGLCGAIAALFMGKKKAPAKKRAIPKPPAPEPVPEAAPLVTSSVTLPVARSMIVAPQFLTAPPVVTSTVVAPPVYETVMQPTTMMAAPVYETFMQPVAAPQIVTAAPIYETFTQPAAAPVMMASPMYAAPVATSMLQPVAQPMTMAGRSVVMG